MSFTLEPIGWVRSSRTSPFDDGWDRESVSIELAERFGAEALFGLDEFSHVDVVYVFDRVSEDAIESGARHPRGNPEWPLVGIFAQRGKNRPNRLGVTTCEVLGVDGIVVAVKGLDAIDGTPVVDIKPHMAEFGPRGRVRQPPWSVELMRDYWA